MGGGHRHPQRVLITGGTRGIGRAVAIAAAEAGAELLLLNYLQDNAEAERTRALCEERGSRCILHRANMGSPADIDGLFDFAEKESGTLDMFVHCAALNSFKPTVAVKPNQWDLTMNIATRAFLQCAQRCVPLMTHGSIIAISSLGAGRVLDDYGALGPAKAALESLVRYLAAELHPSGIRVNAVTAGPVETASIRKFPAAAEMLRSAVRRTPAGRIGMPEDIADIVLFLAGPSSRWIVGQTIVADGGLSLR